MKICRNLLLSTALLAPLWAFASIAATDSIGSGAETSSPQAATTLSPAAICKVLPRPKKLDPKPDAPQKAVTPSISNVCAPVITISTPSATVSDQDSQTSSQISPTPLPSNVGAATPAETKEPVESPDTFKFKVKDLIEADLSSRSRVLVWALVAVFVAFGAIVVFGLKAVAKNTTKSISPWIFAIVSILVAAVVTYWVVRLLAPQNVDEATIEQLYATRAEQRAVSIHDLADNHAFAPQIQRQLATIKDELSEIRRQTLMQPTESSKKTTSESNGPSYSQIVLLLIGGIALGYAFSKWWAPTASGNPTPSTVYPPPSVPPAEHLFPLADIYRLEDLLSMVSAVTTDGLMSTIDRPTIDPTPFLQVLNSVRWQIETGHVADDIVTSRGAALRLKSESWVYRAINSSLKELDEQLSARYELSPHEWRKKVLRQLAATRRVIVQNCENVSLQENDSGGSTAA